MSYLRLLLLTLFMSSSILGQGIFEPPPVKPKNPRWVYEAFSYPDFGTGEEHSYFSIIYKLNPTLHMELRGFYDTYRSQDVFDTSFRMKWYPTKRVYLFSGLGMESIWDKLRGGPPATSYRMLNGAGIEPNENITIEAVYDQYFDKNSAGLNATPSLLTLKGRYRF